MDGKIYRDKDRQGEREWNSSSDRNSVKGNQLFRVQRANEYKWKASTKMHQLEIKDQTHL